MTDPHFDSDLHAMIAGGITVALDFRGLESALGRRIVVFPQADEAGNYMPEWLIVVATQEVQFRLRLTQEVPATGPPPTAQNAENTRSSGGSTT